jgi:hypothetical protein
MLGCRRAFFLGPTAEYEQNTSRPRTHYFLRQFSRILNPILRLQKEDTGLKVFEKANVFGKCLASNANSKTTASSIKLGEDPAGKITDKFSLPSWGMILKLLGLAKRGVEIQISLSLSVRSQPDSPNLITRMFPEPLTPDYDR